PRAAGARRKPVAGAAAAERRRLLVLRARRRRSLAAGRPRSRPAGRAGARLRRERAAPARARRVRLPGPAADPAGTPQPQHLDRRGDCALRGDAAAAGRLTPVVLLARPSALFYDKANCGEEVPMPDDVATLTKPTMMTMGYTTAKKPIMVEGR